MNAPFAGEAGAAPGRDILDTLSEVSEINGSGMPGNGVKPGPRYEIRLAGRLGPAPRLAFPRPPADVESRHNVLITRVGGEDLPALIERLRLRGVEVTAARQRIGRTRYRAGGPGTTRPG